MLELAVRNSNRVSPAWTVLGIVATWLVWLSTLLVAATNVMPAATEVTDFVTEPVAPSLSVTVRVTSRVPPVA